MVTEKMPATPAGFHTLTPHAVVRGAARAAEWYRDVFGAVERSRIPVPDGRLMSIELCIGDSPLKFADEFPEMGVLSPQSVGGTSITLHLFTNDVDALWKRALDAGAQVVHPLGDAFWGERHGVIVDPFGHRWGLAQYVRDVPHAEVARAAWEMFAGLAKK